MAILIGTFLLDLIVDILNIRHLGTELPQEFKGLYDEAKYRTSQGYLKESTWFGIVSESITLGITIGLAATGGISFETAAALVEPGDDGLHLGHDLRPDSVAGEEQKLAVWHGRVRAQ